MFFTGSRNSITCQPLSCAKFGTVPDIMHTKDSHILSDLKNARLSHETPISACSVGIGALVAQWVKCWPTDLADRV